MTTRAALTITGSDSSGGAGIQADVKTVAVHGTYAMSTITALTAQSTTDVAGIIEVIPFLLKGQLDDTFADIFPDAVKVGMVFSGDPIRAIGDGLPFYRAASAVMNLVTIFTSGSRLISGGAVEALKEVFLPMAGLLTPNIPEARMLSEMEIHDPGGMEKAARVVGKNYGCTISPKGDHQFSNASDLLYRHKKLKWFNGRRIGNPNTHGTSYTLLSTVASNLAKSTGMDLAVEHAKVYLSGVLGAQLDLGKGSGPMNHGFAIRDEY